MAQDARREQQVEQVLGYPGVGPLAAGALAKNLGASEQELQPVLDRLVERGRLTRLGDGRYGAPATRRRGS